MNFHRLVNFTFGLIISISLFFSSLDFAFSQIIKINDHVIELEIIKNETALNSQTTFIDIKGVKKILEEAFYLHNDDISLVNFQNVERSLLKFPYIKSVVISKDFSNKVKLRIYESRLILRIIIPNQSDFVIDERLKMHPIPKKGIDNGVVIVISKINIPYVPDKIVDEKLLQNILILLKFIEREYFIEKLIGHIVLFQDGTLGISPKREGFLIKLGSANKLKEKIENLKQFYLNILPKVGFDYYSLVDLSITNQIITKKK